MSVRSIRFLLAALLAAALAAGFICEVSVFTKAFFPKRAKSVVKRIARVKKRCAEKFPLREGWVTLNGGFVRLLGQHRVRGVVKSDGGMLLVPSDVRLNADAIAARVIAFAHFCADQGARFAYVQLPKKLDLGHRLLPPGAEDSAYANADRVVGRLSGDGTFRVCDWRRRLASEPDAVIRYFYRTDHHWNTDGSFLAAGLLASELADVCDESPEVSRLVSELLADGNWTREVRPRLYLGSRGRQTGPLFSGFDDLIVRRPKFRTEQTFSVPSKNLSWHGTFEETVMRQENEIGVREMFSDDAYSILYSGLGKRYPLAVHDNPLAPMRKKVVLIGDSFSRPVEGFLSSVVEHLYAIDPRRPGSGTTVADLVRTVKPDVVVHLQSTLTLVERGMFNYGF